MTEAKLESKLGPTILVSSNTPFVFRALERLIGAQVGQIIADVNSEVVELTRTHQPVLIVLDFAQKTDGRQLLRSLKRDVLTKDIDVFVLTACADPLVRELCLQLGASDCFAKPPDDFFFLKVGQYLAQALYKPNRTKQ